MGDAAYLMLKSDSSKFTGQFIIDEQILREHGVTDFSKYRVDKNVK